MTKSHDGRRTPYARQAQLKRFFRVSREPVPQNPFQIPVFLWNMLSIGPAPDVRRVKRVPTPEGIQMGCCDHLHACTGSLYRTAPNPVWVVVVHAPVIWRLCHLAASNEREQRRKERQSKRPGPAGPLATKITRSKKHMNLLYIYMYIIPIHSMYAIYAYIGVVWDMDQSQVSTARSTLVEALVF